MNDLTPDRQSATPTDQLWRQVHVNGLPSRRESSRRLAGPHGDEGVAAAPPRSRLGWPRYPSPRSTAGDWGHSINDHAADQARRPVPRSSKK